MATKKTTHPPSSLAGKTKAPAKAAAKAVETVAGLTPGEREAKRLEAKIERRKRRRDLEAVARHAPLAAMPLLATKVDVEERRAAADSLLEAPHGAPRPSQMRQRGSKMGRPRKDENGEKDRLLAMLERGDTMHLACDAVGVSLNTMWTWYREDDTFRSRFTLAREAAFRVRVDQALATARDAKTKDEAYCARVVADIVLKTLELHQRSQQLSINVDGATGPVTITWSPGGQPADAKTAPQRLTVDASISDN